MATAFGHSESSRKETETLINDYFDRILDEVNKRRIDVLDNFRDIQESTDRIIRSIEQLEKMKVDVEDGITENILCDKKEDFIRGLVNKIRDLKLEKRTFEDADYQFVFDDKELKTALSTLGVFEKSPKHYLSKSRMNFGFQVPVKTGKFSIDEESQTIAIVNPDRNGILYFDFFGSPLGSFLFGPIGVCEIINIEEIVVFSLIERSILRFQFNPRERNRQVVSETTEEFEYIISLSYDKKCDQIYALSSVNNSIYILKRDLTLLINVEILCTSPQSLFVGEEMIYILKSGTPCLHVLSKSTNKLDRIIQCERNCTNTDEPTSFFVDRDRNIILTVKNLIEIYSPTGRFLHSLTLIQDPGKVIQTLSVFVTRNYKIIVLSDDTKHPIQIF